MNWNQKDKMLMLWVSTGYVPLGTHALVGYLLFVLRRLKT